MHHLLPHLLPEPPQPASTDENTFVEPTLRNLGARITSLALTDFTASQAGRVRDVFPNLTSLRLLDAKTFEDSDDVLRITVGRYELRSLELVMGDASEAFSMDPYWTTDAWGSVGSLCSLRIATSELEDTDWTFVERFAETLEDLDLDFTTFNHDSAVTGPPQFSKPFPQLDSLTLTGDATDAIAVLSSLPRSRLRDLHLRLGGLPDNTR